jgi:putative sugar O-methyltransferase
MNKYLKSLIPPAFIYIFNRLPVHNFKNFWKKNKNSSLVKEELKKMIDFFITSESYKYVSNYWNYLNIQNMKQIFENDNNINNFSTSIALNYYTFIDVTENQVYKTITNVENEIFSSKIYFFKKQKNLNYVQSMKYNFLTFLLFLNLIKINYYEKLKLLGDEGYVSFGDPYIEIEGIKVTSDKINSLFDYDKINRFCNLNHQKIILEIGAGSGRTSQSIMTFNSNCKYVICDIPPALYISYERLKKVFKNKKIGLLYDYQNNNQKVKLMGGGSSEQDLNTQINHYDISFIMPHQLSLLNNRFFDLTIAIDCLHEMDKKTINKYINNINKISKLFYFSVWKKTNVPFSGIFNRFSNNLNYYSNDYNLPKNFKKEFEEDLIFPSNFISSGYRINL